MTTKLQQRAKELLSTKTIGVFIGYKKGDNPELARPVMITEPVEAEKLICDKTCRVMLAKYLLKPEARSYGRRGILASYSNLRAITSLIQEHQIARSDVYIISFSTDPRVKKLADEIIELPGPAYRSAEADKKAAQLMKLSPSKRRAFWDKEFAKCIKCYACRQICPLCYCTRCIADKNQPQWLPTSPHSAGNFMWNLTRAYHLAGRCIDCGECERSCPVGIPLMLMNKMIYNSIKSDFKYEPGFDVSAPPPLATYNPDDKESFIK